MHYSGCAVFHSKCNQVLGLSRPPPDTLVDDFLLLRPLRDDGARDRLRKRAISLYGLHMTICGRRHKGIVCTIAADAFAEFIFNQS